MCAIKRNIKLSEYLELSMGIMHKQRDYSKKNYVEKSVLICDDNTIEGKIAIICDDMCIITHGLFSGRR